jgi:hypothetical protein
MDKRRADTGDAEAQRDDWDEPSWADPFAGDVGRDL